MEFFPKKKEDSDCTAGILFFMVFVLRVLLQTYLPAMDNALWLG
jgi:hypothetical protein